MHTALTSAQSLSFMHGGFRPCRQELCVANTAWMYAACRHHMDAWRSAPSNIKKRRGSCAERPKESLSFATARTTGQRVKCSMLSSIWPQKVQVSAFWNLLAVHQPFSHNRITAHRVDGGIHVIFCKARDARLRMMCAPSGRGSSVRHRARRRSHITSGCGWSLRLLSRTSQKCACRALLTGKGTSCRSSRAASAAFTSVETMEPCCHDFHACHNGVSSRFKT